MILRRDEKGFSSCLACPCHRAVASTPPRQRCRIGQISAPHAAFALRLRARPSVSLIFEATFAFTVVTARWLVISPKETLSIGFRVLVSLHPAIQTTGLLTLAPAGLSPAEHTSLRWTHNLYMRIALYQPDIPQNTGTILRLCACCGIEAHVIGPASFPTTDRAFRRAGMDYLDAVAIARHRSWLDFEAWRRSEQYRLVLFTTTASRSYLDYRYRTGDVLLFGRESAGVPEEVHAAADARVVIPIHRGFRSLNVRSRPRWPSARR